MLKNAFLTFALLTLIALTGCSSMNSEQILPSPLTLDQLEAKMSAVSDPQKCFAQSKNYVLRQQLIEERFLDEPLEYLVEVKYEQPNKFRITYFEENQPIRTVCSNGSKAWIATHTDRSIEMLDGKNLRQQQTFSKLGNPIGSFKTIFDKVEVQLCKTDDGDFYRLVCSNKEGNPLYIYVDAKDFLIKKMESDFKIGAGVLHYQSTVNTYDRREGVMIPLESTVVQNGKKQTVRTIYYKLNQKIDPLEFIPPVF